MKLLFVNPASDLGGVSQYILSILRHLPRDEYDIHTAVHGNGLLCEILRRDGVPVHQLPVDYSTVSFFSSLISLRRFLKRENFDLVHAHTAKAGLLCCLANVGLPAKVVYTGHGFRFTQKSFLPLKLLFFVFEHFICRAADVVTVLSRSEYDFGIAKRLFSPQKARIVSMSVDVERFTDGTSTRAQAERTKLGIPHDAFVVGMIGRITHQKDPETFVNAAAVLNALLTNVWFLWVGDGDLREQTTDLAKRMRVSDRFIITGQRDREDIPLLLSAIDVVLFTSRFEGLPIVLLEAMAAKKLIVAANVGSIRDVIRDGETGWLFDAGNHAKAAAILETIYHNRGHLDAIADTARTLVMRNYTPEEKMAREFQAIYQKVLELASIRPSESGFTGSRCGGF